MSRSRVNPVSYTHLDVYKRQVLGIVARARMGRRGAVTVDAQAMTAPRPIGNGFADPSRVDRARLGQEFVAKDGASPSAQIIPCQMQADAAVVRQRDRHVGVRKRDAPDGLGAVRKFGGL